MRKEIVLNQFVKGFTRLTDFIEKRRTSGFTGLPAPFLTDILFPKRNKSFIRNGDVFFKVAIF